MDSEHIRPLLLSALERGNYRFVESAIDEMLEDFGLTPSEMKNICVKYLKSGGTISMFPAKQEIWKDRLQYLLCPEIEDAQHPYIKFMMDEYKNFHVVGVSAHESRGMD